MKKISFFSLTIKLLLIVFFITSCSSKIAPETKAKYNVSVTPITPIRYHSRVTHTTKARHESTMRSYKRLGKRYYPKLVKVGETMKGVSSWYGLKFNGKPTANGETYNMYASTAAHKTWPMDTRVRVTNLVNHKSTVVRINDRGPFKAGRVIDCSYKAGKALGLDIMGIAQVKLEVLSIGSAVHQTNLKKYYSKEAGDFILQIGSFGLYEGAKRFERKNAKRYAHKAKTKQFLDVTGKALYRVFLVGFSSKEEAYLFKQQHGLHQALIVKG